jgi:ribokinase
LECGNSSPLWFFLLTDEAKGKAKGKAAMNRRTPKEDSGPVLPPKIKTFTAPSGDPVAKRPRIVVVGSLVFDFVARASRLPQPGETLLGDRFGMFPGGKGANQAVQAGRLGAEVFLIGRVGDDFLADRLVASLAESGVVTDFVRRDTSVKTAACCIHVDAAGQNAIVIVPEANAACSPDDVDAAARIIAGADVLLCQLEVPVPTVVHAFRLAAARGVRTILNPAPAHPDAAGLCAGVTVLTPNESEAEALAAQAAGSPTPPHPQTDWESSTAHRLWRLGANHVVITCGARGAYLASPERERLIPTYPVAVVDTTAAGDAFNGALAVALAEGQELVQAVAFANAAGAASTTRPGAQPSLAWRPEVEALMQAHRQP